MLGIKINNENLDLLPETSMEIEQNNPYLQFNDDVVGEFSLPIELPATPKNNRLLKFAGIIQKRIDNSGIEASVYDKGLQHSIGKLKFEKLPTDLNRMQNGRLSAFYLTGISYFYQDIKNKRLRDVNYGGARTFTWDNYNRNGSGFWGHIHKVLDAAPGYGVSGYDYAFPQIINRSFHWSYYNNTTKKNEDAGTHLINWTFKAVNQPLQFSQRGYFLNDGAVIVPYMYLKYLLLQMFSHVGWKVKGDILDDADFNKIIVDNARAIDWCIYNPNRARSNSNIQGRSSILFDLADHVPDVSLPELLLALRNHFGWWYDVDRKSRTVTIQQLKNIASTGAKDMTAKASPAVIKTVLSDKKIYALKSRSGSKLDLSGYLYQGEVDNTTNLPAAIQSRDQHVYLVRTENNYYICKIREDSNDQWAWHILQSNNVNIEPAGANEEISTAVRVPEMQYFWDKLDVAPNIESAGFWAGRNEDGQTNEIILMFYHGLRSTKGGEPYAFASHHIYDSLGNQVGNWSLAFTGKKKDGTDVGLYERNWKVFLEKLTTSELITTNLYLNRVEFMSLRFSDELNIAGVRMYISKIKLKIPYEGKVELECSRI